MAKRVCQRCNGAGFLIDRKTQQPVTCPKCGGSGEEEIK